MTWLGNCRQDVVSGPGEQVKGLFLVRNAVYGSLATTVKILLS